MRRILALLLVSGPLAAHGVVDSTSTVDPGSVDVAWSWVGSLGGATAVAIGPHTVITASHVGATDFQLGDATYRMASTLVAPKMKGATIDLRIVQLRDTLPGWYEIGSVAAKKMAVTMVGYGGGGVVDAKGSAYRLLGGGTRRAGDNHIANRKSYKGRGPSITAMLHGAGDAVLAGGDSGGGWFAGGKLVGVSAFVFTKDSKKAAWGWGKKAYFGSGAIDLTNGRVAKWVNGQILAAPMGRAMPQTAPEPGAYLALGIGGAGLLRRRRGV